jgi:hypothetical protein
MDTAQAWNNFKKIFTNPSIISSEFFRILSIAIVLGAIYQIFLVQSFATNLTTAQAIVMFIIFLLIIPISAFFNEAVIRLTNSEKPRIKEIFSRKKSFKSLNFYSLFIFLSLIVAGLLIDGLVEFLKTTVSSPQSFVNELLIALFIVLLILAVIIFDLFLIFAPFFMIKGRKFWESMKESMKLMNHNKLKFFLFIISFIFAGAIAALALFIPAAIVAIIIVQMEEAGTVFSDTLQQVLLGAYSAAVLLAIIAYFRICISSFFNEINKN